MKILFITDLYPIKEDKTIPKVFEDFALAIKEFGNEVEVIRPNFLINSFIRKRKYIKEGTYIRNGIKIHNLNFFFPFIFNNFTPLNEFDIIISHMPSGNIYASVLNEKLKIPHISIVHTSDYIVLSDIKYKFYFKKKLLSSLKNSTLVGARNNFLKEKLNADFVLPSFVEKEKIIKEKIKNNSKLKIITLSKLIKRKNINLVIEALKEVGFDFEYSICGEGKERKNLEKLIKKYHLEDKIKIYNFIPHNEIFNKLDENDVFILPSRNESFGISYIEAMSRGLIVIGAKNTGIDGFIENNKNGFIIEPNKFSIKSILNKINSENTEGLVKDSIENAKNFTKEKVMKKYFEIIKKIL